GVQVDLVARVGAADLEAEAARLRNAGVTPHLVGDSERPTGRLVALIDPSAERSFYTDRGANEALCSADIPDALIEGASHVHLSGYSFFAPAPREASCGAPARRRSASIPPRRSFCAKSDWKRFSNGRGARRSSSPTRMRRRR